MSKAIELYEQNVAVAIEGHFPYDRLRVIYLKQKRYDQALRVCQAYIDTLDEYTRLGLSNKILNDCRQKAVEHVMKIKRTIG